VDGPASSKEMGDEEGLRTAEFFDEGECIKSFDSFDFFCEIRNFLDDHFFL
jgi:hypothetical protein